MLTITEFHCGLVSLPVEDADALPELCVSCHYLYGKEFSIGEHCCPVDDT